MKTYHFELTLYCPASLDQVERLFPACDDASFGATGGVGHVVFHREAESLEAAIESAIGHVTRVGLEIKEVKPTESFLANEFSRESGSRNGLPARQAGQA